MQTSRLLLVGLSVCASSWLATPALGFKIGIGDPVVGIHGGTPIHEDITTKAVVSVTPAAPSALLSQLIGGVQNADIFHMPDERVHFDRSSATSNDGFQRAFSLLQQELAGATSDALQLPGASNVLLDPAYAAFPDMAFSGIDALNELVFDKTCLLEPACPTSYLTAMTTNIAILLGQTNGLQNPDPHAFPIRELFLDLEVALGKHCRPGGLLGKACFERLEDMDKGRGFQSRVKRLRRILYEFNNYLVWQDLGHALHATQDFFAHTNYVELVTGKKGPPCRMGVPLDLCDEAVAPPLCDNIQLDNCHTFRVPGETAAVTTMKSFVEEFSLDGLRSLLPPDAFKRLQSGWVDYDLAHFADATCDIVPNYLEYCHTSTSWFAGLNKDMPDAVRDQPSHLNFEAAQNAAIRTSARLWAAFLSTLPQEQLKTVPLSRWIVATISHAEPLAWGKAAGLTVSATDSRSGLPVEAQVSWKDQVLGTTNRPLMFTPTIARVKTSCFATNACMKRVAMPLLTLSAPGYPTQNVFVPIPPPSFSVAVEPSLIVEGDQEIIVSAVDDTTGAPLGGNVYLGGKMLGSLDQHLHATFEVTSKLAPIADATSGEEPADCDGDAVDSGGVDGKPRPSRPCRIPHPRVHGKEEILSVPALWVDVEGYNDQLVPYRIVRKGCQGRGECQAVSTHAEQ